MSYANNKGADQPAHPRSLISAFTVRCLDSVMTSFCKQNSKPHASFCSWDQFEPNLAEKFRRYAFSWRGSCIAENVKFYGLSLACCFFESWPFRGCTPTLKAIISSKSLHFSCYFDTKHANSHLFTGSSNGHVTSKYGDHVIWPATI